MNAKEEKEPILLVCNENVNYLFITNRVELKNAVEYMKEYIELYGTDNYPDYCHCGFDLILKYLDDNNIEYQYYKTTDILQIVY